MKVLCCEPDFDTATRWWWPWTRKLVAEPARQKGYQVVELYGNDDNRSRFVTEMRDSVWLAGLGHGNALAFTGQNLETLLTTNREEDGNLMAGRFYAPASCSTGAGLAPWLVKKGAKGTFGYDDYFWLVIEAENWPDGMCKYFAQSHHALDRAMLLEGKANQQAAAAVLAAYNDALAQAPEVCKPYLESNRVHFVWFGDPNAKVEQPSQARYCKLGIYAPNKDPEEKETMISIFGNGCYSIVDKWHLLGYIREKCPDATILMRPFFEGGMSRNPEEIANWACDFVADKMHLSRHLVIGNELNLESPGFDHTNVDHWRSMDDWIYRTIQVVRARLPNAIMHWPALSPGIGDDPNVPPTGMRCCERSINAADVLNVHTYWPDGQEGSVWYGRRYEMVHELFPHKYMFLDECGPGELRRDNAAAEITQWIREVYSVDYVIGLTLFMWNWSVDPHNYYNKPKILDALRALEKPTMELPDDWVYDGGQSPGAAEFEAWYRNWAWNNMPWGQVPFNPDAAFPRAARAAGFGAPLVPEDRFDWEGRRWAGQRFVSGFVYCVEGDWANVRVAKY